MTPTDATAQQHVITARAAAGLSDTGDLAAPMQQARADIAQSAEAMDREYMQVHLDELQQDANFSAANDAALFAADQFDDWWRWTCGIGEF